MSTDSWLASFSGQVVVVDLDGQWMAFGRLTSWSHQHIVLEQADLHDLREGISTRDVYALETRKLGIRVNRVRVSIPVEQIVALSCLDDLSA
ncbi:MAG: hypothetical protein AAB263_17280 [Planctomycetota bacterium]